MTDVASRRAHGLEPAGARVVITGAGSGIGAAMAEALARRGARLLLNDLDPAAVAAALGGEGGGGPVSLAGLADPAGADELTAGDEPSTTCDPVDPATDAVIAFSSGTTGLPKGVQLTHRNLVATLAQHEGIYRVDTLRRVVAYRGRGLSVPAALERAQAADQGIVVILKGAAEIRPVVSVGGMALAEIGPGAKGAAGSGDQQGAGARVALDLGQGLTQLIMHCVREAVEALRAIEG